MSTPENQLPVTILRQGVVEPGTAAPPAGEPFDPAVNWDRDVDSATRIIKRGDAVTVLSSTGEPYQEDIEELKARLTQSIEALGEVQLPPRPVPVEGAPASVQEARALADEAALRP